MEEWLTRVGSLGHWVSLVLPVARVVGAILPHEVTTLAVAATPPLTVPVIWARMQEKRIAYLF